MARQVPKSIDAEKALLGAFLMNPNSILVATDMDLQDEDFYMPSNKLVYKAIRSLHAEHQPIDFTSLMTRMTDIGTLDQIGGIDYLVSLMDVATSSANVEYYTSLIQGKRQLRTLIEAAQAISDTGMDHSSDPDYVMDEAEKIILNITRNRRTSDFLSTREIVTEVLQQMEELKNAKGITGVPTHFKDLDAITNGFQKGDLIIIAARPSMGKTAFAMNCALNAADVYEKSIAVFSLEMSGGQLVRRLLANRSRVPGNKIRDSKMDNEEWNRIYEAAERLKGCKLYIDENSAIKISEIFSKCRKLKNDGELDMVVIDYLQLINGAGHSESRQQEVSEISRSLKQLAREMNCPVIALSQLSRNTEQRSGNHRPILSDLRESGSIEQDADMVIFLHSDDYYKEQKSDVRKMDIIIAKNRNGAVKDANLIFETPFSSFSNYVEEGVMPHEE